MSAIGRFLGFILATVVYFTLVNFIIGMFIGWYEGLPWYGVILISILVGIAVEFANTWITLIPIFVIGISQSRISSGIFICFALYCGFNLLYRVWALEETLHWLAAILLTFTIVRLFSIIVLTGLAQFTSNESA